MRRAKLRRGMQKMRLIIIISVILVTMVPIVMVLFSKPNKSNVKPERKVVTKAGVPTLTPVPGSKVFSNNDYKVYYPPDWQLGEYAEDGDQSIIVKPANLSRDEIAPGIVVSITDVSQSDNVVSRSQFFIDNYNFKTDRVTVAGTLATRVRGTFPASGAIELQESHIYMDKGDYTYNFIYRYPGNAEDPDYEKIFSDFIEHFEFL